MTGNFILTATCAALALGGCTYNDGLPAQTATGTLVGGAVGAVIGQAVGGDNRSAAIGALVGVAAGAAIGAQMEAQAAELRQTLAGTGASITHDDSQIMVVLPEAITFPTASSTVNPGFRPALAGLADNLLRFPASTLRVIGHTDNVGGLTYNQVLSLDRARSVANILVAEGVQSSRVTISGFAFTQPVATNTTDVGRAQNRRVEIIITPIQR